MWLGGMYLVTTLYKAKAGLKNKKLKLWNEWDFKVSQLQDRISHCEKINDQTEIVQYLKMKLWEAKIKREHFKLLYNDEVERLRNENK